MLIRPFTSEDKTAVIELWRKCDLLRPWNDPEKDINRKLASSPELFLVGVLDGKICASAMAGYEGHRGWVNYLAVDPDVQNSGMGRRIMSEVESRLLNLGCPKINVQIRSSNSNAVEFYEKIGYSTDEVISVGKRLIKDGGGQ